jgi:hypothetical protein
MDMDGVFVAGVVRVTYDYIGYIGAIDVKMFGTVGRKGEWRKKITIDINGNIMLNRDMI